MKRSLVPGWVNRRMGFFALLVILVWAKSIFSYFVDFNLGVDSALQYFILFINPIATTVFLLSIALYVKKPVRSYVTMMVIYALLTLLIFSNAVYYREFTDFITVNTMLGVGKVASGLGESALRLFRPYDLLYVIDLPILTFLLWRKKIKIDPKPLRARVALAVTVFAGLFFSMNLSIAEMDRSELLGRTFSRDYMVKYLGLTFFTGYDGYQTYQTDQVRAEASPNDLTEVQSYVKQHYTAPNDSMYGIAKNKNVIYIHLESFQQFLIDYKLKDENGVEHEVTPFLNSLYHSNSTYSFDNFFHQVKAGKTSDAETLLENSLFGLDQGSLFAQLGGKNTFQAVPDILSQTAGYTTAAFHGNAGTFWNRNETYKHLGYQYFFDADYYDVNDQNSFQYGLHDKYFFQQSVNYLQHLQQPFYTKLITVSNHYPYSAFTGDEGGFPQATTDDQTINGYFATANYLDTAISEFFNYLKTSGLYDNSVIVLYGDHYGISNSRNPDLAELLGKSKDTWSDYDNAMLQRVPFMIHVPGQTNGGINHTYSGEVDVAPTLLHLLGVDTTKYVQLGQDLFSSNRNQIVSFRSGEWVTPQYTSYGGTVYDTATGAVITPNATQEAQIKKIQEQVTEQLTMSDKINNGDLLRFDTDSGLKAIDPADYSYKNLLKKAEKIEKEKGAASTSIYSEKGDTKNDIQTKSYKELHPETTIASSSAE
ncbi:LTA synthase family protein [Enterococcus hirae]|nr:LTA synthase family protein [Enterococcus hirae]